jgi:hypothetical protein
LALLGALVVVGAAGCSASNPLAVELQPAVDPGIQSLLVQAIQDEYRAETVYLGVTEDFGPVNPFQNIIGAEVRHSTALGTLFTARGWDVPENGWTVDDVPHFTTVGEACSAGVQAEIDNAGLYDDLIMDGLPADVLRVFESNRAASLERHLPAFNRCAY